MCAFTADAGEVDDGAATAPAHVRSHFLHENSAADQVHIQCLLPFLTSRSNTVVQVGAGDIYQAINTSPVIDRLLYDRVDLRIIGNVGMDKLQTVSRFLFQFTAARCVDITNRYPGAGPDKFKGNFSAD